MASYEVTNRTVSLTLTRAEARALSTLASSGAEGLLTDRFAAEAYIGPPASVDAAYRALHALTTAAARPLRHKR